MKDYTKAEKVCSRCNELKPKADYSIIYDTKKGTIEMYSMCKFCANERKKEKNRIKKGKDGSIITNKDYSVTPENTKLCIVCDIQKPVSDYNVRLLKNGLSYSGKCKLCRKEHDAIKYKEKLQLIIDEQKKNGTYIEPDLTIGENRICNICEIEKSLNDFEKHFNKFTDKIYHMRSCKTCNGKKKLKRQSVNKKLVQANFGVTATCMTDIRTRFKKLASIDNLKIDYSNLTVDWYNLKLEEQERKCPICERTVEETGKRLVVDHNHSTGKVRGLLCTRCNTNLGGFSDSVEILQKAIDYLKLHE